MSSASATVSATASATTTAAAALKAPGNLKVRIPPLLQHLYAAPVAQGARVSPVVSGRWCHTRDRFRSPHRKQLRVQKEGAPEFTKGGWRGRSVLEVTIMVDWHDQ